MNPQKTTIDWLRFRSKTTPEDILYALRPMYGEAGNSLKLKQLDKGVMGFQNAAQISIEDMPIGRIDYGGESQRGWARTDLTGKACEWIQDWDAVAEVEDLPSSQIRRLDIALTTWNGEVTHDRVVEAHNLGRFTICRPPTLTQVTSSDTRAGKTCYIGKREKSDKFMRCYEKGFEMVSKSRIFIAARSNSRRLIPIFHGERLNVEMNILLVHIRSVLTSCQTSMQTFSREDHTENHRPTLPLHWRIVGFSSDQLYSLLSWRITATSWRYGTRLLVSHTMRL